MDWNNFNIKNKRTSLPGVPQIATQPIYLASGAQNPLHRNWPAPYADAHPDPYGPRVETRSSYYGSQYPLYCVDWATQGQSEWVALGSFREGFQNRIEVVHGLGYRKLEREDDQPADSPSLLNADLDSDVLRASKEGLPLHGVAFDFAKVADVAVDFPATKLQWDPTVGTGSANCQRLAASSEVLRLYRLDHDALQEPKLVQTHMLANNSTANTAADSHDISTFPPVTSFDWNECDSNIIITLSVDTTCTVWDLNRSHSLGGDTDNAHVKTQLIAHDLEVFDVKFIKLLTDVFASVSNDGSMRVFDLRALEHSTIIYEPTLTISPSQSPAGISYNSQALIRLACSNVDQNHLATIGVNLNQVLIIDIRMPGVPVLTLDGLFGGISNTAINSLKWHPLKNQILTGGDDCQALVWDCPTTPARPEGNVVSSPILAYDEELEVNNVCWRQDTGDWMGVVSGKGFQAVQT